MPSRHRFRRTVAFAVAAGLLAGCAIWRPVVVPLPTTLAAARCPAPAQTLLVMLPGSYSRAQDFEREGFVAAVRARGIAADVLLADAHLGYYRDRTIVERLHVDVIGRARASGYRQVWLVGISVGAYGALAYARAFPDDLAGVVAIGPYLGGPAASAAIRAQGGLASWRAPAEGTLDPEDADTPLWQWLQPYATASAPRPPLYLGYGRSDRFIEADTLLAAALPPGRVFNADGGHDWGPWRAVWDKALDAMPLPRSPDCRPA